MGKEQKERTYNLSESRIKKLKEEARNEGYYEAFISMFAFPVMVLRDHFPELWKKQVNGKSREERFTDLLADLWNQCEKGEINLEDCRAALQDECGITMERVQKITRL